MPSPADLMLSQGGVALENSADAARCYPGLWPSPDAARQAFHRAAQTVTNPNREFSYGECHGLLRRAVYQRAGARMRSASLAFDPVAVPQDELQGWLEERVGPLARFELDPQPPPPEAPRPRPSDAADADIGAGSAADEYQVEPDASTPGSAADPAWPVEPARRPPEAVNGSEGMGERQTARNCPLGPLGRFTSHPRQRRRPPACRRSGSCSSGYS